MNKTWRAWLLVLVPLLVVLSSPEVMSRGETAWKLDLSGKGKFFDLPYPTELRRQADGSIRLDDFPKVLGLEMVGRTRDAASHGYGFSPAGVIYFRLTGPVTESFPAPEASRAVDSSLFFIDVDPDSPERGRRFPLIARFYKHGPADMTGASNLLAMTPYPGFVPRANNLYAAGVTTSLKDRDGRGLAPSAALAAMARGEAPEGELGAKALELYGPVLKSLAGMGVKTEDLAALTVFRTGDPTARAQQIFDGVKDIKLELDTPLVKTREYETYTVLEGALAMPQFQDGTPPFSKGRGGRLQFDAAGKPVVQRLERVPFAVSVPKGRMPDKGFPLLIFIHGTAGVSTQFIDRGEAPDDGEDPNRGGVITSNFAHHEPPPPGSGPALILARRGIAGVGAAQPVSGERGGRPDQIYFYNFLSPEALRDNMLQATAEASMLLRFMKDLEIDPSLCPGAQTDGGPVRFDGRLIFGMGQSLGSLILGPWGGVETDLKALIPSGNGAYWTRFMAVGNPLDMKRLKDRHDGLTNYLLRWDQFHPVINLMGTVLAPADPFAYQGHYFMDPLPGRAPKNVWASFGLFDHYFYPETQDAAMLCMGLDFVGPVRYPATARDLALAGLKQLDYPVTGNKQTPSGPITAVALQYEQKGALDGHHINYQRDDAKYQYGCFLWSLVHNGTPTAYAPKDRWDAECGD